MKLKIGGATQRLDPALSIPAPVSARSLALGGAGRVQTNRGANSRQNAYNRRQKSVKKHNMIHIAAENANF
jgi:hypothetical protein